MWCLYPYLVAVVVVIPPSLFQKSRVLYNNKAYFSQKRLVLLRDTLEPVPYSTCSGKQISVYIRVISISKSFCYYVSLEQSNYSKNSLQMDIRINSFELRGGFLATYLLRRQIPILHLFWFSLLFRDDRY